MTKVIAFANQKGGVAKTTSTINTAHALVDKGQRVLLIDADPQASLSLVAGISQQQLIDFDRAGHTLHQALLEKTPIQQTIFHIGGLDIIPGSIRLARIEQELQSYHGIASVMRHLLAPVAANYDAILIDCPPTLSLLTVNALTASQLVVIPCKTDFLSVMGIPLLMETITETKARSNPQLRVLGILPTIFNTSANHDRTLLENLREVAQQLKVTVWEPVPRSTTHDNSNADRSSVVREHPASPGANRYSQLADTIIAYGLQ